MFCSMNFLFSFRFVVFDRCCLLVCLAVLFFFKQKTAYEMRISDWSSDVCSSDLTGRNRLRGGRMAAGVTERLQIMAGGDAGLLHSDVRKQMAAGRVLRDAEEIGRAHV